MLKKLLMISGLLAVSVTVIACSNTGDDRVQIAAAQVAQAQAEATAAAAGAAQANTEATAAIAKAAQAQAEATVAAAEVARANAEATAAVAEAARVGAEATAAAALATSASFMEPNDCPSGDTPIQLGLIVQELDSSVEAQVPVSLFQEGKEIAAGTTVNGLFSVNLKPGLYTAQVQYGAPPMKYQKDLCLKEEGSLTSIKLPFGKLNVQLKTTGGQIPFRPYSNLTLLPAQVGSNNMQPIPINRYDSKQRAGISLNILEGEYDLALTYTDANNEPHVEEQTATVRAGQPLTVTFSMIPEDGTLVVEALFDQTLSSQGNYQATMTIVNDSGVPIGRGAAMIPQPNLRSQATQPLLIGQYNITIAYQREMTTTYQVEVPIEIQTGKITFLQVSDVPTSTPTIDIKEPTP